MTGFYLMGMWYKRSEAQKRFSFFFSSTTLAGAFGGLLAYGLAQMNGARGYSGWRWVFIIEGVITAVVAIILFFLIPDFPEDTKWLKEEEREFIRDKLANDVGKSAHQVKMGLSDIAAVFKDCKLRSKRSPACTDNPQTRSFSEDSCTLVLLSRHTVRTPTEGSRRCSFNDIGYAYFAPSIIKSYGYDCTFTSLPHHFQR